MIRPQADWREAGGSDPIDEVLGRRTPPHALQRWLRPLRNRAALGLAPTAAPAVVFVPLGMLLGPHALNILSPVALAYLDTVVSVALAVLGVFVGLAVDLQGDRQRRLLGAASVEALITVGMVAAAFWYLLSDWQMPLGLPTVLVGLALGVSASASAAVWYDDAPDDAHLAASRIADFDDLVPILLGGLVIVRAAAPMESWVDCLIDVGATIVLGLAIGFAGWLLFERAHSRAERNVFIAGILALIGGMAAYLALSPLLAGLAAGMLWTFLPGGADAVIREDLRKIQHPLIVLLLLVAGALCTYSLAAVWLCAALVLFRLAGKLAGGWVASRLERELTPGDLGAHLVAPGLFGIAFMLNVRQVLEQTGAVALLTAVVACTLVSEVLAVVLAPAHEDEQSAASVAAE